LAASVEQTSEAALPPELLARAHLLLLLIHESLHGPQKLYEGTTRDGGASDTIWYQDHNSRSHQTPSGQARPASVYVAAGEVEPWCREPSVGSLQSCCPAGPAAAWLLPRLLAGHALPRHQIQPPQTRAGEELMGG